MSPVLLRSPISSVLLRLSHPSRLTRRERPQRCEVGLHHHEHCRCRYSAFAQITLSVYSPLAFVPKFRVQSTPQRDRRTARYASWFKAMVHCQPETQITFMQTNNPKAMTPLQSLRKFAKLAARSTGHVSTQHAHGSEMRGRIVPPSFSTHLVTGAPSRRARPDCATVLDTRTPDETWHLRTRPLR